MGWVDLVGVQPMSAVDREKLEMALKVGREIANQPQDDFRWQTITGEFLNRLCDAAEAHLSTLPKTKEVPVEMWGVADQNGYCFRVVDDEGVAREWSNGDSSWSVVRLTGTATVPA